jgi:hypothetical protein
MEIAPTIKERITLLEREMMKYPQVEIIPNHYFSPGIYVREITIPAGVLLTGKTHITNHLSIMLAGEMDIMVMGGVERITAPFWHFGKPGTKRVGIAIKDSLWITCHITEETDLEKIEKEQFSSEDEVCMFDFSTGKVKQEFISFRDQEDFKRMLKENNLDEQTVREQSEFLGDQKFIDLNLIGLSVGHSDIEGSGLFCDRGAMCGEVLSPARLEGYRTQAGRFTNHSVKPNATMVRHGSGDIYLTAISDIQKTTEITIDYRESLRLVREERTPCLV